MFGVSQYSGFGTYIGHTHVSVIVSCSEIEDDDSWSNHYATAFDGRVCLLDIYSCSCQHLALKSIPTTNRRETPYWLETSVQKGMYLCFSALNQRH